MANYIDHEKLIAALEAEIMKQIQDGITDEIERAKAQLEVRLRKDLAHIACSLAKNYRIESNRYETVISIRNET